MPASLQTLAAKKPVLAPSERIGGSTRASLAVGACILIVVLAIGLATARNYGISIDEFNTADYGPKALAWYTSGFRDRSSFETVEAPLWYYGPWFQMLTAYVQSFALADPLSVRHALTFAIGLAGLAALLPLGWWTFGRWAGVAALVLCLTTGYVYGSLFFTPIDVPFLFAMSWATCAIVGMARSVVPSWRPTLLAGIFTGLAIATRPGGIITHVYLIGAMILCGLEAYVGGGRLARRELVAIALRTIVVVGLAWLVAVALWPWLQTGFPLTRFQMALAHFVKLPVSFPFQHWGERIWTDALPVTYIPGQLAARLPIAFLLLLVLAIILTLLDGTAFAAQAIAQARHSSASGGRLLLLQLARARRILIIWVAAMAPVVLLILEDATLYDGIRHILFVIPMLALLAGGALIRFGPLLTGYRVAVAGTAAALYIAALIADFVRLHPLEYVAMNSLVGGVPGAYGRFDLDYWSIAGTEALRRLEHRIDIDAPGLFDRNPPRLVVCIPYREHAAGLIARRPWKIETEPAEGDFVIETERSRCARGGYDLIDEVRREDRTFAWTWRRRHFTAGVLPE